MQDVYDIETESDHFLTNNVVVHNCFIQSVSDDLVNEGGIMDLWMREARIFKYGSGTGSQLQQAPRRERAAQRRRQVSRLDELPEDRRPRRRRDQERRHHPPRGQDGHPRRSITRTSKTFVDWKVIEEQKVAALVTGSKLNNKHLNAIMKACHRAESAAGERSTASRTRRWPRRSARRARSLIPDNYIERVIQLAQQGFTSIHFPEYNTDWNSEAYATVSGQNSNNTVRVTNDFMQAVIEDSDWGLCLAHRDGEGRARKAAQPKREEDAEGARPVGEDCRRRLAERRPRHAVSHHDQRVAHLPGRWTNHAVLTRAPNTCSSTTRPATWPR